MKMDNKQDNTVSIIVPVYNGKKTIGRCIDSLIKQTYKPTEIIVVDDGSTDETGQILDRYDKNHDIITVIYQQNSGVSAARNRGLTEASSKCILFVDGDDEIGENYVESMMQYVDYDYVTCGFHVQNNKMKWEDMTFVDECQKTDTIRKHPSVYLGKYYFGSPWAKLYKRSIIEDCGLRFLTNIHLGEDIIFNFNYLLATSNIRIVPICEYYYYYQKSSLSRSSYQDAGKWTLEQERLINAFFNSNLQNEKVFMQNREIDILQRLLQEHQNKWTKKQFCEIYNDPLFQSIIQDKRENGSYGEKLLIFSLDHNAYFIYKTYVKLKEIMRNIIKRNDNR